MNKSLKIWDFRGCNHTPHNKQWELVNFEWNNTPNQRTNENYFFYVLFADLYYLPFNVLSNAASIFYIPFLIKTMNFFFAGV